MINTYLNRLLASGTHHQQDYAEARRIEFANKVSLFFSCICVCYSLVFGYLNAPSLIAFLMGSCFIYIACIVLNHFRYTVSSKLLLIVNSSVVIYCTTAAIGRGVMGQFFFVFIIPLTLLLFTKQQNGQKIVCLFLPILGFLTLELTDYRFFLHVSFSPNVIQTLSISVFIIICVILVFIIEYYQHIFNHLRGSLKQAKRLYPLTERELEVIDKTLTGKGNKAIANELYIEESTVKNHLKSIYKKLSVSSRSELISKCLTND